MLKKSASKWVFVFPLTCGFFELCCQKSTLEKWITWYISLKKNFVSPQSKYSAWPHISHLFPKCSECPSQYKIALWGLKKATDAGVTLPQPTPGIAFYWMKSQYVQAEVNHPLTLGRMKQLRFWAHFGLCNFFVPLLVQCVRTWPTQVSACFPLSPSALRIHTYLCQAVGIKSDSRFGLSCSSFQYFGNLLTLEITMYPCSLLVTNTPYSLMTITGNTGCVVYEN